MRAAVGPNFILIYRISLIDLVPDGSTWDEVVLLGPRGRGGGRKPFEHRHWLARSAGADDCHLGATRGL